MSAAGAFYNSGEMSGDVATLKSGAGSDAKLIGSVWSPPANCKSNNSLNDGGGHLMSSCYTSWATTIANFAGSNGFYAMSIANEPDFASCGSTDPCNGNYPTTLYHGGRDGGLHEGGGTAAQGEGRQGHRARGFGVAPPWSNVSAGPDVGGHESSDPLKCGCFPDKNTNSCACRVHHGDGLRLRPRPGRRLDGVGRHRHPRRSRVRLAGRDGGGRATSTAASPTKRSGRPRCRA